MAGTVPTMLPAGEHTPANTLARMIHLLHRHAAALQRVQHEVRTPTPDPAVCRFDQAERLV